MKRFIKLIAAVFVLLGPCTCLAAEQVVTTTLCDLVSNPQAFNHKLVRLSGDVTHGYKLFTFADTCKPNSSSIWLNYGGQVEPPSVFSSQPSSSLRSEQLVIEGIPTTLVDDVQFKRFNKIVSTMADRPQARVTLVGRYFAGHPQQIGELTLWKGFGPLQCCTLFVIQQVIEIKSSNSANYN